MTRSEPTRIEPAGPAHAGSGMLEPPEPGRSDTDALVDRIIAEELRALRQAFSQGAEYAVTHMETPRERMLHRLECPALEPHLERHALWTDHHRRRLDADRRHRLSVPALMTRDAARSVSGVRSCKVCWPNVHGSEPRPLRRLKARGLRTHHVGHMLSTADGDSLGTIVRSALQSGTDLFGVNQDSVEVVTTSRTLLYSPSDHVFIWDLPTDEEAIRRKMQLFQRLGSNVEPASWQY